MIGIDTNVLVRILVEDDAAQARRARALVDRADDDCAALFVSVVVLCETAWVLRSGYRATRTAIATALSGIVLCEQFEIENRDEVKRAISAFENGRGDFADYVIREVALARGAVAVATFDRTLWDAEGFVRPDPDRWSDDLSLHERSPRYGRRPPRGPRHRRRVTTRS